MAGRKMSRRRLDRLLLLLVVVFAIGAGVFYHWQFGAAGPDWTTAPHFVFSIDGIVQPTSVTIYSNRIFVTEAGGDRLVHVFDSNGQPITSFAPPGTTSSSRAPLGVAVSKDEEVYVSDGLRHDIAIYSIEGEFIGFFVPDNDPDFEWMPVGLTFDKEGNLYVTDQRNPRHQILVFDPAGNLKLKFGYFGIGEGMFNFPTDVAVDDNGNIYVSDSDNFRVQVFDAQGNFVRMIGGGFSLPRGIGIDHPGRLHVVDSLAHEVWVLSVSDELELVFSYGGMGLETGQFCYPSDIALDSSGRIYITNCFTNLVQVWSF